MNVYTVTKEGVYRHEILGIFSTLAEAKKAANSNAEIDNDNYHTYDVTRFKLGKIYYDKNERRETYTDGVHIARFRKGGD